MGIFALVNPCSHCIERIEHVGLERKYGRDFEVPLTTDLGAEGLWSNTNRVTQLLNIARHSRTQTQIRPR
jgi:hypothetical protein